MSEYDECKKKVKAGKLRHFMYLRFIQPKVTWGLASLSEAFGKYSTNSHSQDSLDGKGHQF